MYFRLAAIFLPSSTLAVVPQVVDVFDLSHDAPFFKIGTSKPFDHYNFDGFNGGISSVCFTNIVNQQRRRRGCSIPASVNILAGVTVYYAGIKKEELPVSARPATDQGCFSINGGEVISTLEYKYVKPAASSANGDSMIANGLRIHTRNIADGSVSRSSQWYGCESCFDSALGVQHVNFTAPHGKQVVAFKGLDRTQNEIGWLSGLQVYMGDGDIGTGSWTVVGSGVPGRWRPYKTAVCTKYSSNVSETDTKQWASGVTNELSVKFSFFDVTTQEKNMVYHNHSGSVVKTSEHAFSESQCVYTNTPCNETYLFQFQFSTDYRKMGEDITSSSFYACADRPPCCLPLAYSRDPSNCDLQPDAPNFCPKADMARLLV